MNRGRLYLLLFTMVLSLAVLAALSGCRASEAKFPAKPINMIVNAAAGGPVDLYGREIAKAAEKILKVSIPVENMAGGGGATAMVQVREQPADGYTLGVSTGNAVYIFAKPDAPVKLEDFDWLIRNVAEPSVIGVKADSPFKSLKDLADYAKSNPGKVKMGGTNTAGYHQATLEKFAKAAGVKMSWVAFEGGSEALVACLGGHVDAYQATVSTGLAQIQQGQIRLLGVANDTRLPYIKDTPTYKEQGFDVSASLWRGIYIKKGTPPTVVKTLHDAFKQASETSEFREYVQKNQLADAYLGTEDFTKTVAGETQEAAIFLKEIGIIK